ncbi:MAG: peroxiredoxin family protein [Aurantibacter sp.]
MRKMFLALFCGFIFACSDSNQAHLQQGIWLMELEVMDKEVLPFNFRLSRSEEGNYTMEIYNAEETITVDEIRITRDSIIMRPPVFQGYMAGKFSANRIEGQFIKEDLDRIVPFTAIHGVKKRFRQSSASIENVSGIWETEFSQGTEDSYMAKGIFRQSGDKVNGTFRTTTGDYRYLEGVVTADSLKVSAFDGAHAFLFTGKVTDSTLVGTFYSGNHFKEPFVARRNEAFELPDADSLTFLKEGYDRLTFSFPDADGNMISLQDERFKDKVTLVQIMGTWCPNCLDETKFYVDYLRNNPGKDIEVVALAFEYAKTKEGAFESISRLKERIKVDYPVLLAQFGTSDKKRAQEKLPMLNHVLSYPTTIYVDKKGVVRKIHTGFNGPATGDKHQEFKEEFNEFVQSLLEEETK